MKTLPLFALISSVAVSQAAIVSFDLSPAGTDKAVGLSSLNEFPAVTNSSGSGNEIGTGIVFDTETLELELAIGYGSAFGFGNLTGPATDAHIHGPAGTNVAAPAVVDLAGLHALAANPALGGSITGSLVLTTNQAADLMAGLYYINVHTLSNAAGEIRGQLIPGNTLPVVECPPSVTLQCAGPTGTPGTLNVTVSDAEGDPLTVVWSINGVAMQTNSIALGASTNASTIPFSGVFAMGTTTVSVSVSDGFDTLLCNAVVTVVDTLPPTIVSASITPNVIWPPNNKMVPVTVSIVATDICGTVTSTITSITSNQTKKKGKTGPDWTITGTLTAELRATRKGKDKTGRIYTVTVQATDSAGNSTNRNLFVLVPHDQGNRGNSTNTPGHTGTNTNNPSGGGLPPGLGSDINTPPGKAKPRNK